MPLEPLSWLLVGSSCVGTSATSMVLQRFPNWTMERVSRRTNLWDAKTGLLLHLTFAGLGLWFSVEFPLR